MLKPDFLNLPGLRFGGAPTPHAFLLTYLFLCTPKNRSSPDVTGLLRHFQAAKNYAKLCTLVMHARNFPANQKKRVIYGQIEHSGKGGIKETASFVIELKSLHSVQKTAS
ncbi:hypothetical protein HPR01_004511 [Salmonella enterica]|nr:hypothetical protein [Salmonella enterica]